MSERIIGRIIGRTTTTDFRFLVKTHTRKWDYVFVRHQDIGPILAQVTEIEKSDSETVASCNIIGYREPRGFLRKPRTPLEPGTHVAYAEDNFVTETLGLKSAGLNLGLVEGRGKLKAFIDPRKLITKHLAVIAKSGSGKSYAVGVILEELAELNIPVIILDPHGEYSTLKKANKNKDDLKYFEHYGIEPKAFPNVKEYALNTDINLNSIQLKLQIPRSPHTLVDGLPFKINNAQKGLLYSVVNDLKERNPDFEFKDIISELELTETNAKWGVISGIENLQKTNLFSLSPTASSELIKPNQITIINLKGTDVELQQVAVQSLVTKLFEDRKFENIPPFFLVVEEAHNFVPERGLGDSKSASILRTVASEGRKFGLGLCVVSQRPARVEKNVLSQCTSQIILQITNPGDLKAISSSFEGVTSRTEKEIRGLPIGRALVIGSADHPVFVDIRVRKSSHGGRAQTFEFENSKLESEKKEMIFAIEPQISRKEVMVMENKKIKSLRHLLEPCLYINAEKGEGATKVDSRVLFSLNDYKAYQMTDGKLSTQELSEYFTKISPMQKKVLKALNESEKKTLAELFVKTGFTFAEVNGVVESLVTAGILQLDGKKVNLLKQYDINIASIDLPVRSKFLELDGEQLDQNIPEEKIISLLLDQEVKVNSQKLTWLPFYEITFEDGSKKVLDSLTYSFSPKGF